VPDSLHHTKRNRNCSTYGVDLSNYQLGYTRRWLGGKRDRITLCLSPSRGIINHRRQSLSLALTISVSVAPVEGSILILHSLKAGTPVRPPL
ncbi:hypothetical protein J6590_035555, partial [Homalodisca vitripennis]